jgi:hypothetical protein
MGPPQKTPLLGFLWILSCGIPFLWQNVAFRISLVISWLNLANNYRAVPSIELRTAACQIIHAAGNVSFISPVVCKVYLPGRFWACILQKWILECVSEWFSNWVSGFHGASASKVLCFWIKFRFVYYTQPDVQDAFKNVLLVLIFLLLYSICYICLRILATKNNCLWV